MQHKRDYLWALVGRFIPQVLYLITTMILARFISPSDFGKVGVLSIIFVVANVLMDAGLGGSLVKEKELKSTDCSTIFVFNLIVSHILYLILFFSSDVIESFFDIKDLSIVVKLLSLVFVINSWGLVPASIMTRNLQFKEKGYISILAVLFSSIVSIVLAYFGLGVYSIIVYQIIQAIILVVLSMIISHFKISFVFRMESFKKLLPFGAFTSFSVVIDTIYENLIVSLLGKYLSASQAGFFYQAKNLEEAPSRTISNAINTVSFPVLSKLKFDIDSFKKEAFSTYDTVVLVITAPMLLMAIFSKEIVLVVYGESWIPSAPYLSLLIVAAFFVIIETLNRNFIKSLEKVESLFVYTLWKRFLGIVIILLALLLSINYVVYAYIISSYLGYIFNTVLVTRYMNVPFFQQQLHLFKLLLPSIILLSPIWWIYCHFSIEVSLIIAFVFTTLYYVVICQYLKINILSIIREKNHF